jgi:hypothetical protein
MGRHKERQYGVRVETFQSAGRFQHTAYDIGVDPDRKGEVCQDVVELLKQLNEKLYNEMPEGAHGLESKVVYTSKKQ